MSHPEEPGLATRLAGRAALLLRHAGALTSLALVVGLGVWGYKLWMRDVTGIPVVRAMQGPMREAPKNPGGEIALHTGLAVNDIAAMGEAAGPEERLVLAPRAPGLTEEDLMVQPTAEADERRAGEAPSFDPSKPMTAEDIAVLADRIAAGVEEPAAPAPNVIAGPSPEVIAAVDSGVVAGAAPSSGAPMRPALRPRALRPATAIAAATATAPETEAAPVAVSTREIAPGTSLVQLGAFDSPEVAGREWGRLTGRFGELFNGRERLVQEAMSGGRTFFRLRATGFEDLADARRFCAALVAEDAACIPVVVR
ncbi:SPOR domain-containing protein [Limimaricola pyoseonensis]|uniref:Sporulation related domain-containing protein n=1 Tax=Limimaricola pyoseonensis TaxID=521013 RepID=A0A1G7AS19_9RHOB|nr:SPOR domain-containing protein [Limimaricola pyoseonensis]SDE17668.1 Sporulation related domain-containing protein [Limimaricola pyoseonensis]